MTSPKGWDTAEAARLRAFIEPDEDAFLHSLACVRDEDGELVCVCTPARARDEEYNDEYHGEVGHILESQPAPASCSPRRRGRSRISRSDR